MAATISLDGGGGGGSGGQDRVFATAQQIVKSLNTPKEVREDMPLILSSFDNRLSGISDLINGEDSKKTSTALKPPRKLSFVGIQKLLDSPDEAVEYLSAVDEIIQWIEQISITSTSRKSSQIIVDRAEKAIQLAMSRLEDELRHVLIRNSIPLDAESLYGSIKRVSLSFTSHDGAIDENLQSFGEMDDSQRFHERGASIDDDFFFDLVHPDAILELEEIIDLMIRCGYEKECLRVYSSVRRDALDECLVILGFEKLSIEEVQKIAWKSLDEKMKNWVQAVKNVVRVLLTEEKRLCDSVFGELDEVKKICFNETAKGCVVHLLNFAEAIAICERSPEKLFRILDMYEALRDALPELQTMVSDEFVIGEARGVLKGIGEAAKGTFTDFENCIQNESPKKLVITGDVHPLPRYVMNYLKLLVDYNDPLDSMLEVSEEDVHRFQNDFGGDSSQLEAVSPLGRQLLLLMSELEHNLDKKSKLYADNAMQYIFLMNNMHYLVRKVKDSDLGKVLGDDWI